MTTGLPDRPAWNEDGSLARIPRSTAELNALLDDPRTPALLRQLASVTLHRVTVALGRADCTDLLAIATPEQVRELLDLEVWRDGAIDPGEALDWISFLLRELPEQAALRDLRALDVELIALLILRQATIHLADELDPDREPEGQLHSTPDGWFVVELRGESPERSQQVVELIDALYRAGADEARRLLQAATWELPLELEELERRWRDGRLQDLGFADPGDALALYAYLAPGSVALDERSGDRPPAADPEPVGRDALVAVPPTGSFLGRALAAITDEQERDRLSRALAALGNRAVAADRVPASDLEGIERSLRALHARLSLGLEHLAGGDLERARALLGGVALIRIARVGHSLVLDLRRPLQAPLRAGELGSAPGRCDRLDPPLAEQLAALAAPRPAFYDRESGERRPFRDRHDLATAGEWIADALAVLELARGLGLDRVAAPAHLSFGDLYRSAIVVNLLGEPQVRAVGEQDLRRFLAIRGRDAIARAADDLPAAFAGRPRRWVERWLRELSEHLGALDPERLELRFVGGLWLAAKGA
jgi:hypothetical protein